MQAILFNDMVDMFENDFIKGQTYFRSFKCAWFP